MTEYDILSTVDVIQSSDLEHALATINGSQLVTDEASHRTDTLKQQQDIEALEVTWLEEKQHFILKEVFRNLVKGDYYSSYSYLNSQPLPRNTNTPTLDLPQPGEIARKALRNPQPLPQDINTPPMTSFSDFNLINISILAPTTAGVHVEMTLEQSEQPSALMSITWVISILRRSYQRRYEPWPQGV